MFVGSSRPGKCEGRNTSFPNKNTERNENKIEIEV